MGAGEFNPSALIVGVTTLVGGVTALTLSGALGRLQRNEPGALKAAFVLLIIGAVLWALAALPVTGGAVEAAMLVAALLLSAVGLLVGLAKAVETAGEIEQPAVTAKLTGDGRALEATAKVGNLASKDQLVVLVDGLTLDNGQWNATTIVQEYVGPDGDGQADVPITFRVPPGRFEAVGVKAWVSGDESIPCGDYPRQVSAPQFERARKQAGTGCLTMALPPIPEAPRLSLSWMGESGQSSRLRLQVATNNAPAPLPGDRPDTSDDVVSRVAVQVAARTSGENRALYRALLSPDLEGTLDTTVEIPVRGRFRRICAEAHFAGKRDADAPKGALSKPVCPVGATDRTRSAVELRPRRQPRARD